jgi:D-glycero-alpha-D-manno-heptose-7-phosphate kinase
MLFFTGITRNSSTILKEQQRNITSRKTVLHELKQMAYDAAEGLQQGNIDCIGELLHESWELKKSLASQISNPVLDEIYNRALMAGATGGKITGAGGGGFFMFYCPHEKQENLRNVLHDLQELPFLLEHDGTKVIFNYHR